MNYGIIFGRNSSCSNTVKDTKRIIRIMIGAITRDSCREYFKKLNVLPLQSQYLLSLVLFVINSRNQFAANSEIHSINTKNKSNFHQPLSILTSFQKEPYFVIKVFICLPEHTKIYLIIINNLNQM